jgi:hypothetical protein
MWIKQAEATNILDSWAERKYDANIPKVGGPLSASHGFHIHWAKMRKLPAFTHLANTSYQAGTSSGMKKHVDKALKPVVLSPLRHIFLSYHFDLEKIKILTTHFTCTEVNIIGLAAEIVQWAGRGRRLSRIVFWVAGLSFCRRKHFQNNFMSI